MATTTAAQTRAAGPVPAPREVGSVADPRVDRPAARRADRSEDPVVARPAAPAAVLAVALMVARRPCAPSPLQRRTRSVQFCANEGVGVRGAVTAVPASTSAVPQTFGDLLRGFPAFVRKSFPTVIASAVAAGVVGYVVNIWIMAVKYDGTNDVPKGTPATTGDNLIGGALFWALFSAVVFGIGSYAKGVGFKKFLADMRTLPRVLAGIVRRDGDAARIHLLWGACAALLAGLVLPPATGALLAVGFFTAAPTVLGNIVSSFFGGLFSGLLKPIAPNRARPVGIESMMVGLIGSSLALSANFVIPDRTIRLVLAVVCGGLALLLSQQVKPPTGASALLAVLGITGVYLVAAAAKAKADDGSFAECGNDIARWLSECGGADKIRRDGIVGAVTAALGAPPGAFVGKVVAEVEKALGGGRGVFPSPDQPPPPPEPQRRAEPQPPSQPFPSGPEIDERLRELNRYNPNATPPEHQKAIDDFMEHIRRNGGRFTPDDLRTLEQLEGRDSAIANARHRAIVDEQNAQSDEWFKNRKAELEAEAAREAASRKAMEDVDRAIEFARKHQNDLPGAEFGQVGRALDDIEARLSDARRSGKPFDPNELAQSIRDVNKAIFDSNTGRSEREGAAADMDAAVAADWETRVHRAQLAATAAAALTGIGIAAAGAAGAGGTVTVFGSNFASSTVGTTLWGLGGAQGGVTGYREGSDIGGQQVDPGLKGALAGAARATLPVNLVSEIANQVIDKSGNQAPLKPSDFLPRSLGEALGTLGNGVPIVLATVQDIGNVGGLGDAAEALKGAHPAPPGAGGLKEPVLPKEPPPAEVDAAGSRPKPKTYTGTDYPVPGAQDGNVKTTWDALGADGRGKIYGPDGKQIAEVLPDGRIRSTVTERGPDGKIRLASNEPIDPNSVRFGADGKVAGYDLPDGRHVDVSGGNPVLRAGEGGPVVGEAQGTRGRPGDLDPSVAQKWDAVRAGPNGEIYGADGRVVGHIDTGGNMVDANGRTITDIGKMSGGRVDELTVAQPKGTSGTEPVTMKTREPTSGPPPSREITYTDAQGNVQKGTVPLTDDMAVRGLRPGDEVPRNNLHELGISGNQADEIARVAREGYVDADGVRHPVTIEARSTNPESMQHIRDGTATPKPLEIKAKTINSVDAMLGARPEDVGKVGFFEPKLPGNMSELPPNVQEQVMNRFNQRAAEQADLGPKIAHLEDDGFLVRNPNGTLDAGPGYKDPTAVGKPFAGDVDMVSIRNAQTGEMLPREHYEQVVQNAKNSGFQAQHGAEEYMPQDVAGSMPQASIDKLKASLEGGHQTGSEVVYKVGPDGRVVRGDRRVQL
jgi:hypothetical protein